MSVLTVIGIILWALVIAGTAYCASLSHQLRVNRKNEAQAQARYENSLAYFHDRIVAKETQNIDRDAARVLYGDKP